MDRQPRHLQLWHLGADYRRDGFLHTQLSQRESRKKMEIEVDWTAGSGQAWPNWPQQPLLSVYPLPGTDNYPDVSAIEQRDTSNRWSNKTIFGVVITPNPTAEWVVLKGDIVVDHVAISTICIPEPATLGLLIGGALWQSGEVEKRLTGRNGSCLFGCNLAKSTMDIS